MISVGKLPFYHWTTPAPVGACIIPPVFSPGASLVLGAFVALAGPPDLLVRFADRSEPIELHPHLLVLIPWRLSFRPAPRSSSARRSLETVHRTVSPQLRWVAPNPLNYTRNRHCLYRA